MQCNATQRNTMQNENKYFIIYQSIANSRYSLKLNIYLVTTVTVVVSIVLTGSPLVSTSPSFFVTLEPETVRDYILLITFWTL